ncbi:hypothetical protein [Paenibacillus sinopodophylli]|nr:hypothetical protein [Paenibacillus sinopodophylli]
MFKIQCECGASNDIEAAEHLDIGDVEITVDRNGKLKIFCNECSNQVKSV